MYRTLCSVVCFLALCHACLGVAQWTRLNPHVVANGTHIDKNATHISFLEPTGRHSHYRLSEPGSSHRHNASRGDQGGDRKRSQIDGWISSFWVWDTPLTYMSAQWTVPNAPASSTDTSVIYIFTSLEGVAGTAGTGGDILQPVLQYTISGWALGAEYGIASTGEYVQSNPIPVNPGDTITGVIQLSNGVWSVLAYANAVLVAAVTIAQSALDNGGAQNSAQWALEVYYLNDCTYFPPNNLISLTNIVLQQQGVTIPVPTWSVTTNSNPCDAGGYSTATPAVAASATPSTLTITWQSTGAVLGAPKVVASVGVDISGGDFGTVSANSALACAAACDNYAQCTGWSWDSQGQVTCWLKSTVNTREVNSNRISGVKQGQVNIDRNGPVLPGSPITLPSGATASTCAAYCNGVAECQAWAWNSCGPNQCWLKGAVGAEYAISCRTSGVKGVIFTDRPGGDLSSSVLADGADSAQCANLCASTSGCTNWAYEFPSGPSCSTANTCWLKTGGLPLPNVNLCRAVGNVN